jgi:hypothetical protein
VWLGVREALREVAGELPGVEGIFGVWIVVGVSVTGAGGVVARVAMVLGQRGAAALGDRRIEGTGRMAPVKGAHRVSWSACGELNLVGVQCVCVVEVAAGGVQRGRCPGGLRSEDHLLTELIWPDGICAC